MNIDHKSMSHDCDCGCPIPDIKMMMGELVGSVIQITVMLNRPFNDTDSEKLPTYFDNNQGQAYLGFFRGTWQCEAVEYKVVDSKRKTLTDDWRPIS